MQDNEIRRLDLKARQLSSDIIRLEESTRKTGRQLRNQQKIRLDAERCWNKLLTKALNDNKNSPWPIKKELIVGNLRSLALAKNLISSRKLDEKALGNALGDLASKTKKVIRQIEHVKNNLAIKTKVIESRREDVLGDELASMKAIPLRDLGFFTQFGTRNGVTLDNFELRPEDLETRSADPSDSDSKASANVSLTPWKVESELRNTVVSAPSPAASHCRALESDGKRIPRRELSSSQRWTKAESIQNIISEQNQNVKVLVHHSAAGEGVIIDYQHAPGRMLTVAGYQATSSKSVALNLQASNQKDRARILKSTLIIQESLENSGLLISKLEVEK